MDKFKSHIVSYLCRRTVNGKENDSKHFTRQLFDSAKDLYKKDLSAHFGCVNAIEFSTDGNLLFSGGDDRRVLMWNVNDAMMYYTGKMGNGAKPMEMKRCHYSNIFCLAVDDENKRVLSGSNDDQVIVHDYSTGNLVDVFLHDSPVFSLSLNPANGNIFASAADNGRILIYDIRESKADLLCVARLRTPFHGVMFNPCEPSLIATANSKLGVHLWDLRKPKEILLKCNDDASMAVRWNHSGTVLLALRNLLPIVIYNPLWPEKKLEFDAGTYFNACTMKSCSFAGDGDEYILSGSDDFNLYMWKIPEVWPEDKWVGSEHLTLTGHRSIVNQVRYSSSKQLIATSGVEKIVKLWSPFHMPYSEGSHDKPIESHHRVLCSSRSCSRSPGFLTHDYSQESVEEDTRMIHFFDNLLRNELDDVTILPLFQSYHLDNNAFSVPSKKREKRIYEKLIRNKKKRLSKILLDMGDEKRSVCTLSRGRKGPPPCVGVAIEGGESEESEGSEEEEGRLGVGEKSGSGLVSDETGAVECAEPSYSPLPLSPGSSGRASEESEPSYSPLPLSPGSSGRASEENEPSFSPLPLSPASDGRASEENEPSYSPLSLSPASDGRASEESEPSFSPLPLSPASDGRASEENEPSYSPLPLSPASDGRASEKNEPSFSPLPLSPASNGRASEENEPSYSPLPLSPASNGRASEENEPSFSPLPLSPASDGRASEKNEPSFSPLSLSPASDGRASEESEPSFSPLPLSPASNGRASEENEPSYSPLPLSPASNGRASEENEPSFSPLPLSPASDGRASEENEPSYSPLPLSPASDGRASEENEPSYSPLPLSPASDGRASEESEPSYSPLPLSASTASNAASCANSTGNSQSSLEQSSSGVLSTSKRSKVSLKLAFSYSNESNDSTDSKALENEGLGNLKDSGINLSESSDPEKVRSRAVFRRKRFGSSRCYRNSCKRKRRALSSDSSESESPDQKNSDGKVTSRKVQGTWSSVEKRAGDLVESDTENECSPSDETSDNIDGLENTFF